MEVLQSDISTRDAFGMLEPCDGKLSRTVLRGEGSRKAPALPDRINKMNDIDRIDPPGRTLSEMITVNPDVGFGPSISDHFLERYGEDSVFVTATVDFLNHRFNQTLINGKRIPEDHEAIKYGAREMRECLEHLLQVLRKRGMDKAILLLMRSATGYEHPEAFLMAAGSLIGERLMDNWIQLLEIEDYICAASLLEAH